MTSPTNDSTVTRLASHLHYFLYFFICLLGMGKMRVVKFADEKEIERWKVFRMPVTGNLRTEVLFALAEDGETPCGFALHIMRDSEQPAAPRMSAAKLAVWDGRCSKICHPPWMFRLPPECQFAE